MKAIAEALNLPLETAYQQVGLLPKIKEQDEWVITQKHRLKQIPIEWRNVAENILRALAGKK